MVSKDIVTKMFMNTSFRSFQLDTTEIVVCSSFVVFF